MKRNIFLFLALAFIFVQCEKEDDGATGYAIQVGHSDGAYFYSNFPQPIIVDKDYPHEDMQELNLDGQGEVELRLISLYDTSKTDTILRSLELVPQASAGASLRIARVSNQSSPNAQAYLEDERVDLGLQRMLAADTTIALASLQKALSSGHETTYGNWQGRQMESFVADFYFNGVHYVAWVMISVDDYDRYKLHNFASFIIP